MELRVAGELMQARRDVGSRFSVTMDKFRHRRLSMNSWNSPTHQTKKLVTPVILRRKHTPVEQPQCLIDDDTELLCSILEAKSKPPDNPLPGGDFQFFTEVEIGERESNPRKTRRQAKRMKSSNLFQEWKEICNDIGLSYQPSSPASAGMGGRAGRLSCLEDLDMCEVTIPKPGVRISVLQKFESVMPMKSPDSVEALGDQIFVNEGIRVRSSRASRASTNYSAALRDSAHRSSSVRTSSPRNLPPRLNLDKKGHGLKLQGRKIPVSPKSVKGVRTSTRAGTFTTTSSTLERLTLTLIDKYSEALPTLGNHLKAGRNESFRGSSFMFPEEGC
jgi:hypothetical protein